MAQKRTDKTIEGSVITIVVYDESGEPAGERQIDVAKLPQEIQQNLLMHGASQKIGDCVAGTDNPESALTRIDATVEQLQNGEWKAARSGGGATRTTLTAKALARAAGVELQEAEKKLAELDDEQVKAIRKSGAFKKAMAEIKLEEANAAADKEGESLADLLG